MLYRHSRRVDCNWMVFSYFNGLEVKMKKLDVVAGKVQSEFE